MPQRQHDNMEGLYLAKISVKQNIFQLHILLLQLASTQHGGYLSAVGTDRIDSKA